MLYLNVEAATPSELLRKIEAAVERKFAPMTTPVPAVVTDAVVVEEIPPPSKSVQRRTAAMKSPTPPSEPAASPTAEAAPAPAPTAAPDNAAASATITKEQVRAKLAQVAELDGGKGLAEATKIVNAAGYQKIGSIEDKDYAAIIAACDARLAQEKV